MAGYILIQTEPRTVGAVLREVQAIEQVIAADAVTGPFDIVARTRGAAAPCLQEKVVRRIERIDGVCRALPCPVGAHVPEDSLGQPD